MELIKWIASIVASIVVVGAGLFIAFCALVFTTAVQIGGLLVMLVLGLAMAIKNSLGTKEE